MFNPNNPKHRALKHVLDNGGTLAAGLEAYDAADLAEPDELASTTALLDRNPHVQTGDPTPADWARLSISEQDEVEDVHPGLSERILRAATWEDRRAADWRTEKDTARIAEHDAIAADPSRTEAYLREQDAQRFHERYWGLAPDERKAEATRLNIDLTTYEAPDLPYGR